MSGFNNNIVPLFLLLCLLGMSSAGYTQEPAKAPIFTVAAGTLIHYPEFHSVNVPPRNVEVWLPPGYDPGKKYPVLYMHDGQMLFDSEKTWNKQEWGIDETIGEQIVQGKIRPLIVIGIWNLPERRHSEYFPQKPFEALPENFQDSLVDQVRRNAQTDLFHSPSYADRYLKFITTELKPFIDKNYPTLPGKEHTYIAGSSMGGLISIYAICEYPETFGGAACLSTHWPGIFQLENNPIPETFLSYLEAHLPDPGSHRIYFDHGTATLDTLYGNIQLSVNDIFTQGGYGYDNFKSMIFQNADHSENAWRERFITALNFLHH